MIFNNVTLEPSKGSGQTAQKCSLMRGFAWHGSGTTHRDSGKDSD